MCMQAITPGLSYRLGLEVGAVSFMFNRQHQENIMRRREAVADSTVVRGRKRDRGDGGRGVGAPMPAMAWWEALEGMGAADRGRLGGGEGEELELRWASSMLVPVRRRMGLDGSKGCVMATMEG